ncbi:hypothetical protein SOCE26_015370 [Sorangium cellulosum]|uniref:Uncharacterized protein n=1 Tax=Sorangium cellulosum TaxID=56 RepID=A0A2L0ELI1_SORCE|nr:hypothetical protein [Sorangium cellulosum]AUX40140.1 hypothetical protein SOCE26_015370 [Sorangium cellulosum]
MRTLRFYGTLSLAALWAQGGCGEPFSTGPAAATTSSGSGGGEGGAGGAGGAGGVEDVPSGTTSSSSSGGGGAGGCDACKEGEFCTVTETCLPCNDRRGVLSFGPLTEIDVEGTEPSFPRVRAEVGEDGATQRLVYVARFGGASHTDIATATGRPWTGGAVLVNAQINTGRSESGPLLLPVDAPSPVSDMPPGPLLFDHPLAGPGSLPAVFAADFPEGARVELIDDLLVDAGSHSVAVAHALSPARYWFMSMHQDNGVTVSRLVTKRAGDAAVQPVNIKLPGGCPAEGADLAPWVTPDGSLLFFQAPYSALGDCAQAVVLRSFYVRLGADGLPVGEQPATILLPNEPPRVAVKTPSLSPDECTLFVASNADGAQRLYSAARR